MSTKDSSIEQKAGIYTFVNTECNKTQRAHYNQEISSFNISSATCYPHIIFHLPIPFNSTGQNFNPANFHNVKPVINRHISMDNVKCTYIYENWKLLKQFTYIRLIANFWCRNIKALLERFSSTIRFKSTLNTWKTLALTNLQKKICPLSHPNFSLK